MFVLSFGELVLKGGNEDKFIDKAIAGCNEKMLATTIPYIMKRMRHIARITPVTPLHVVRDRVIIENILNKLILVAGIATIIPMTKIRSTVALDICQELGCIYNHSRNMCIANKKNDINTANTVNNTDNTDNKPNNTSNVESVVSYKVKATIPHEKYLAKSSRDWEYFMGQWIRHQFNDIVDLKHGDLTLYLKYDDGNQLYGYTDKIKGLGGLPMGSEGSIIFLVTTDSYHRSLVSIFSMVKRGSIPVVLVDMNCDESLITHLRGYIQCLTKKGSVTTIDIHNTSNTSNTPNTLVDIIKSLNIRQVICEGNDHNTLSLSTELKYYY